MLKNPGFNTKEWTLSKLFDDLFVVLPQCNNGKNGTYSPPMIMLHDNKVLRNDIFFELLPIFNREDKSAKSYISKVFGVKKKGKYERKYDDNVYANSCYKKIKERQCKGFKLIKEACVNFLSKCTYDVAELQEYLKNLIYDYVETKSNSPKTHREQLSLIETHTEHLFALALILSILKDDGISYKNGKAEGKKGDIPSGIDLLFSQITIADDKLELSSSDRYYLRYLESKNFSDINSAVCATRELKSHYFDKEIRLEYIKALIDHPDIALRKKTDKNPKPITQEIEEVIRLHESCGEAYYLMSICFQEGIEVEKSENKVLEYIKKAIQTQDFDIILRIISEKASILSNPQHSSTKEQIEEICLSSICNRTGDGSANYAKAAYALGQLYKAISNEDKATHYYEISANTGFTPAIEKLKLQKRKRTIYDSLILPQNNEANTCYLLVDGNEQIASQLVNDSNSSDGNMQWNIYGLNKSNSLSQEDAINFISAHYVKNDGIKFPQKCVFAYFSDNLEDNLNNTLHLLDNLYNICLDIEALDKNDSGSRRKHFIDSIDIYLSADYDIASMLIDASLSDMGSGFYFKVHICDRNKDAARQLLTTCPIFISCLKSEEKHPHIITFGNSDFIYNFIREATASSYMSNHTVRITAVGDSIARIENKFKQTCEGIYSTKLNRMIQPKFFELDLTDPLLSSIVTGRLNVACTDDIKQIAAAIYDGNYYVVDIGSDVQNIAFARKLRSWLLRGDPEFKRLPFIAVRCKDKNNSYLAQRLTIGNKPNGDQWYNNYDLYCFDDSFPNSVNNDILESLSLNVHLSYYGGNTEQGAEDYHKHSYNRDSSTATAVALIYRMFDAGVYHKDYRQYADCDANELSKLAQSYDETIKSKSDEENEVLYVAEQARWNCYMLTRGYLYASPQQVISYMKERKSNSHKQELCKLHPYLCDWSELSEDGGSNFAILKAQIPDLPSPRESTIKSVKDTLKFFTFDKEKNESLSRDER